MSLINDALKKAARQRAQDDTGVVPPMPGGVARSAGQGGPMSTQTMVLIGAAALVLIAVSAVVTGMLFAGKFEKKATATMAAPDVRPAAAASSTGPAIAISLPKPIPTPVVSAPLPAETQAPVIAKVAPTPPPVVALVTPATVPAAPPIATAASQAQNDLIQGIVDKYHVSGVRSAGSDSKALIDGHVYKQNEYLDRTLGLKLVGVDQDHLTFVDKAGNTYVKTF